MYLDTMTAMTAMNAMDTTVSADTLTSLYYLLYGGNITGSNDEEEEEDYTTENAFVMYLGYLGARCAFIIRISDYR